MKKLCSKSILLSLAVVAALSAHVSFSQEILENERAIEKTLESQINVEPALIKLFNRPIVILRAPVFGHSPSERVKTIEERFSDLARDGKMNTVSTRQTAEGTIIMLDGELLMLFSNNDLDPFSKETVDTAVQRITHDIENVIVLIRKQKDPKAIMKGTGLALVGFLIYVILMIVLYRLQRWLKPKIGRLEDRLDAKLKGLGVSSYSINLHFFGLINKLLDFVLIIFITYTFITFALHQFPYTEPWGKKLGSYILDIFAGLFSNVVVSLPNLFVVFVIFIVTHSFVKISKKFFKEVAQGNIVLSWLDPEAASPSSKIFTGILWIFAIVMAYPYIPGSNTEAFKGIGVFLGLLISLGASSMVGQVIGGMVLMYSRSIKKGEIVEVGENFGKVTEIGFFSTRIMTPKHEEINIPNAVLMGTVTKNYSRLFKTSGVILHTSVTIGYDVPWRQVQALLRRAADKTAGLAKKPEPFVIQKALSDFYVEYELNAYLETPDKRLSVRSELHASIQDQFNEFGVQIMSPNFEDQPSDKVWVPKEKWYEAPAEKE